MVRGYDPKPGDIGFCELCVLGKMVRQPFPAVKCNSTSRILECVHVDRCGPMPTASLGGAKYFMGLVDQFSSRAFTKFLHSKDEAYEAFLAFVQRRQTEVGSKLARLRSDNGTEFVNQRFTNYFTTNGVKHERTTIYTPQSNGVAERMNRTLLDKARTMMINAKLPISFWAEAVATANYLRNCTPTKQCGTKTPMEIWSGHKPSLQHIRVFGCDAYYKIVDGSTNKLEPRAKKGILSDILTKEKHTEFMT